MPLTSAPAWRQGDIIELAITDLGSGGEGVGRWEDRVVFVPNTVPGDRVRVQLMRVKPTYSFGKSVGIITASPDRVRPACIVADKCGGCQWQAVAYPAQLSAKHQQVVDALTRIGGFEQVAVDPVLAAAEPLGYRNKATYPLALTQAGTLKAGYYRKGSHRLVNLNQCPVQDSRLDPLLAEVKQDIQAQGWKIYDEATRRGHLRYLSLRIGRRTGQILLTLVSRSLKLDNIEVQAQAWLDRYPNLVGVLINLNWKQTNRIWGPETQCVAGQADLEEEFAGLRFQIQPATFFQVNTAQAEQLLQAIQAELALSGQETIVDAYCGIGTLTLPLAQQARRCIGLESHAESVAQAEQNAAINQIENVEFLTGDVAEWLPKMSDKLGKIPDLVVLDPPRKGCDPVVLDALLALRPKRIVYVSCNPATLARDLKQLCQDSYRLTRVQPADLFPQTAHIESAAFLVAQGSY
ncbi:23S rRNA (uracil(1939)-C(5))-methyltransferase RlmD [Romeria aff. gracilis LEGE 07310]|uniref:23S rRNA (Uracil(1939)-C(5))-methyltransferase RlmD n=2 Tax=Vasconcelosia TaxID=3366328 RepID=A0A8J7ASS8_9CYAN|nr:23S rRNA (uracil(1939)-C(5))-methyltransferase RlmD [Romeria aff. gracilis LEGE 07310]